MMVSPDAVFWCCFIFGFISFLWELYLSYRQYKKQRDTIERPDYLLDLIDEDSFRKARAYSLDKARFAFAHDIWSAFENTMTNIGHDFHLILPDETRINFHSFKFSDNVTFLWFGFKFHLDLLSSAFCHLDENRKISTTGLPISAQSKNKLCDTIAENLARRLKNNKQIFVCSDLDYDDHAVGTDGLVGTLIRARIFEEMKKFSENF